mmetsp:Transcript_34087/g.38793  ORF Transcript_34087/g.38793 Transcript_34087/m.38793 type:complete len:91 (+) Transcript_34087:97-369(+)
MPRRIKKKNRGGVMPRITREDLEKEEMKEEVIVSSETGDNEERRFILVLTGIDAFKQECGVDDTDNFGPKSNATFAKHQVNYSATKYIKP